MCISFLIDHFCQNSGFSVWFKGIALGSKKYLFASHFIRLPCKQLAPTFWWLYRVAQNKHFIFISLQCTSHTVTSSVLTQIGLIKTCSTWPRFIAWIEAIHFQIHNWTNTYNACLLDFLACHLVYGNIVRSFLGQKLIFWFWPKQFGVPHVCLSRTHMKIFGKSPWTPRLQRLLGAATMWLLIVSLNHTWDRARVVVNYCLDASS